MKRAGAERARAAPADGRDDVVVEAAEEAELVERVRRGDAAAFDELVRHHMRRAFRIAFRILEQREDAEDLVQEAFLIALERIDTHQPGRPFGPWFTRILLNRGMNASRARALRRTEPVPAAAPSPCPSPLHAAEQAELRDGLRVALDALPERQRTIVHLREMEGLSSAEIAEILDVSPGTVRWHLHKARTALRDALRPFARRNS